MYICIYIYIYALQCVAVRCSSTRKQSSAMSGLHLSNLAEIQSRSGKDELQILGLKPRTSAPSWYKSSQIAVCCMVLQCVAVCCMVLQCVAVYGMLHCIVLQCAAVCCMVLQCVAVCCNALQCVAVCCRMTDAVSCRVAVCCSVLQCVAVCCCVL